MNLPRHSLDRSSWLIHLWLFIFLILFSSSIQAAENFPKAGWHRGDVNAGQENSREAIMKALYSPSPNIEVDLIHFIDAKGKTVGLISHDYEMKRMTGKEGVFNEYKDISQIPLNIANRKMPGATYLTVIDLFEIIKKRKTEGVTPTVSLDLKEEGDAGEQFGEWIGKLIREYGFQKHVFASSFFKSNSVGVKKACAECMVGGLVFDDHWALQYLDYRYTSLDLTGLSKATFFLGFLGKEEFPHDFVLIQDDILIKNPEVADYWRTQRKVKFIGAFVYNKDRSYTEDEWKNLKKADWLELDPPQMEQYLRMKK